MTAFCMYGIGQIPFIVTLYVNHEIPPTLLEEKEECFSRCFFSCQCCFGFFSLSSQAEGRILPGIRELCPKSKHPQEASGVASKVCSTVASHVEREVLHSCERVMCYSCDWVEKSSCCVF